LFGGLLIGMAAALTTVFYPAASEAVIYAIMMVVLLLRPRADRRGGLCDAAGLYFRR
jgi:branched-subunit amino acid ABC-type transport system permease component